MSDIVPMMCGRVRSFANVRACSVAVPATADTDCGAIRIVNRPVLGFPFLSVNNRMTPIVFICQS